MYIWSTWFTMASGFVYIRRPPPKDINMDASSIFRSRTAFPVSNKIDTRPFKNSLCVYTHNVGNLMLMKKDPSFFLVLKTTAMAVFLLFSNLFYQ